jgi:pimeloyl-ACP methyl ester carboxylesterase
MPRICVNGASLAYEVLGSGSPIVWTPGGWFPRENWVYLNAGSLASHYQIVLWDRPNCGASDVRIEDALSELHLWADYLHHLLHALDLSPAYLAGGSNGSCFSLLMAHRYPDDVKGLILNDPPTDSLDILRLFVEARYYNLAIVAETDGMHAVVRHSTEAWNRIITGTSNPESFDWLEKWAAETISMNAENRERFLSMNPQHFAAILKRWGDFMLSGRGHVSGLTDDELAHITTPALVVPGFDPVHPRHTAEALHRSLANAEWVEYADHYPQELLERVAASDASPREKAILTMPFIKQFLQRIEAE